MWYRSTGYAFVSDDVVGCTGLPRVVRVGVSHRFCLSKEAGMNYDGQIVDRRFSDGLSVRQYWARIFRENEMRFHEWQQAARRIGITATPKRDMPRHPSTDEELANSMSRAFPLRVWSRAMRNVVKMRNEYNTGVWGERPVWRSHRYMILDGVPTRITARGSIY